MADCNDDLQKTEVVDDPNSIQLDHPGSENLEESRPVHLESLEASLPVQPESLEESTPVQLEDRPAKICYREWSPLVKLLSQIPTRIHRNIVGYDLVT
jgi:hypothetical protein